MVNIIKHFLESMSNEKIPYMYEGRDKPFSTNLVEIQEASKDFNK